MHQPQRAKLETALRQELLPGEQLLWSDMPDPARMRVVFWLWAFALPWTLFALFWEGTTLAMVIAGVFGTSKGFSVWMIIFPIFGLPFVGIGLWLMNKPLATLADARHQIHALTDRRLMTLTMRKEKALLSADINKTGPIHRKEKADGWGSLSIETGSHVDSDGDRITDKFEIYGIAEVAKVERLLRTAQQSL